MSFLSGFGKFAIILSVLGLFYGKIAAVPPDTSSGSQQGIQYNRVHKTKLNQTDRRRTAKNVSSLEEKPLFAVRPKWFTRVIAAGGIWFIPIGLLLLWSFLSTEDLPVLGISILDFGLYVLIVVIFWRTSSTYEFYETFFTQKYGGLGKRRGVFRKARYLEVEGCTYLPRGVIIKAVSGGERLSFVVRGNPKNRELDVRLVTWLRTKIGSAI